VNVSAVIFSKVDLISMFVGELPKLQMWRYNRKKKNHVEISRPAAVSVYSSHIQNGDLLNSNTG
jgi:glycyl-tRNA synthetase beta subunit